MKKLIQIKWMHCISCEVILEKELKNIKDVNLIMVSHKKGIMEVEYKSESDYKKIVEIIEKNNFSVSEEKNQIKSEVNQNNFLLNIIAIMIVVLLLISSKIFDLNSFIPDTNSINYMSAILIWIVASISTCLAITWWIIIGFSKYFDKEKSFLWHLKVQTSFQLWRILWFFILWGILWYLGKTINFNFTFTWIITFFVGILLFYMWLNILWILPSITKFGVHMPKSFIWKIEKLWNPKYAPIVWALTFFLPCWFTQTMQLLAIWSWSFLVWWLVMMFFALWTFPVLYSLWLGSSYFTNKKFVILSKIIWAVIIFFWISTILNSYNLLKYIDLNINSFNKVQDEKYFNPNADLTKELEIVKVSHNWYQTIPSFIELKSWGNYKIIITPTSNWIGCMSTQVIPGVSNKVSRITKWVDIEYEIYNAKPWKYDIVCASMWMTQGQIIIK